jgi:hypothetical protein
MRGCRHGKDGPAEGAGAIGSTVWDITKEVERHRKIITQLDAAGMDNSDAQLLLSRLENALIVYLNEREKLRAEVAKIEGGSSQGLPPTDR